MDVRRLHKLPQSRVFRLEPRQGGASRTGAGQSPYQSTGYNTAGQQRSSASIRSSEPSRSYSSTQSSIPIPAPVRNPDPEAGEEMPPPPYAAEDPDPSATMLLQQRLAAESTNDLAIPSSPRHIRTSSTSSSYIDAPRPSEFPASPAVRAGSLPHTSNVPPIPRPSSTDPEEAERRAREESELEEALRVSRAAEEERLQYEAAVQASLASAEADVIRRTTLNRGRAGNTVGAGAGTQTTTGGQWQGGDGNSQSAPGSYPTGPTPQVGFNNQTQQSMPAQNNLGGTQNDLDMLGDLDFNAAHLAQPIQPTPTGMTAQATGSSMKSQMKSRNPFLTAEEREARQAAEDAAEQAAHSPPVPPSPSFHNQGTPVQERELPPLPSRANTGGSHGTEPPSLASLGLEPTAVPILEVQPPSRSNTDEQSSRIGSSPPSTFTPPSSFHGWKHPPTMPLGQTLGQPPALPPRSDATVERRASRPLPRPGAQPGSPPILPSAQSMWGRGPPTRSTSNGGYTPHGALNSPPLASPPGSPMTSPPIFHQQPHQNLNAPSQLSATRPSRSPSPGPIIDETGESVLEMLREYDTVFLVDDSSSMVGERWEQAQTALRGVVRQAIRYDDEGVDIYFLNSKRVGKGLRTSEDIEELFAGLEPRGATPTGLKMEAILRDYMSRLEASSDDSVKPMNLIVVTDGGKFLFEPLRKLTDTAFAKPIVQRRYDSTLPAPTDDPESVIISIARRLDRGDYPLSQVGVQLLQIGDDVEVSW